MNIVEFFNPKDFGRFKYEVNKRNLHSLYLFSLLGIPVSLLNVLAQNIIVGNHSDIVSYAMLGYFVLLYIYQKIFLPRNLRWSTLIVYLVELPPLIMTILMGTVLDPTHQALTFLLFICTLPVFILDKPWRVLSYSLFWTLLFLLLVFVFKDPKTWKGDSIHVLEYFLMSSSVTAIILSSRIESLRLFYATKDNHDQVLVTMKEEELKKEKKLLKKLQKEVLKTQEANQEKAAFIFRMSHDIRTPMTAIVGYSNLLTKYQDDAQKRNYYLEQINEANSTLLSIITNVLEIARIEKGSVEVVESVQTVDYLTEYIFSTFEGPMAKKNISFSHEVDIRNNFVYCDPIKLRTVFQQLLSNAVKYTKEGGMVHMSLVELPSEQEGYVLYQTTIIDNGIGMSKDFLPHIFEEFSREQNTIFSKEEGSGLGMAIVKKLLELMKGEIEVKSEKGKGTTFTVTIPHRIATKEEVQQHAKVVVDTQAFKGKRILLAEDNELNAEIETEILTDTGFIVDRTPNGLSCFTKVSMAPEKTYDLVLMDIEMPNMNGYEAAIAIRSLTNKEKASIPIIAMTANAYEEDQREALASGMNGYIAKPMDVKVLIKELAKIFQITELHRNP